jgi:hypothetical protein
MFFLSVDGCQFDAALGKIHPMSLFPQTDYFRHKRHRVDRVILLPDGRTVYNAFFEHHYEEQQR